MDGDIYKRAINTFNIESQIMIAIEETSELTKELCKFFRNGNNIAEITEEMADVCIMIKQLTEIFKNEEKINEVIEYKLNKLDTLIYLHNLHAKPENKKDDGN